MPTALTQENLNDPVTAHLRRDVAKLLVSQTVGEALESLRAHRPGGRIVYLYVVDADDRLCGVVPTRELLLSTPQTPLADIMLRKVVSLPGEATVMDACEFFIQHRLLAFPVVDSERRILGVVDLELYTDELRDLGAAQQWNDVFQLIGVYREGGAGSAWSAFRRRFPWLGCNLAAGLLAAFLSGVYEPELTRVVALAFFIPVVLNLAESVSSQSVSLALQALHDETPSWSILVRKLRREVPTGLLLGLGAGAVVSTAALIQLHDLPVKFPLAACLIGGVAAGVTGSAILGLAMPIILRLFRIEPRVAAGPIALAGADVITILIYFNLARWLLP
jgi:magnesium transporter